MLKVFIEFIEFDIIKDLCWNPFESSYSKKTFKNKHKNKNQQQQRPLDNNALFGAYLHSSPLGTVAEHLKAPRTG